MKCLYQLYQHIPQAPLLEEIGKHENYARYSYDKALYDYYLGNDSNYEAP